MACAKLSRSRPGDGGSSSSSSSTPPTAHVAMVGAVGADTYGQLLLDNLAAHGVDASGVAAPAALKTGIAIILVDEPTGQNRIVLSPEANHAGMAPGDFAGAIGPRVFGGGGGGDGGKEGAVVSPPDLLIMQLEVPLPTVLRALEAARAAGVPVLLNPAPAVVLPDGVYAGLAHLVVNETEASILSGLPVETLDTAEGCREVAAWFAARGVAAVIITLGGRGVYYYRAASSASSSSGPGAAVEEGLVPAEKVKAVVDTTAAGDTFVGQYALDVVSAAAAGSGGKEFAIEAAVKRANRAAARTVERKGAQDSIPWRDELA